MDRLPKWFSGLRVNYAENLLYSPDPHNNSICTTKGKEDAKIACTEVREGISDLRHVTWRELRERTATFASAMRATGVRKGDRAAVVASNSVDTLCVFLAITALGGLFSSSSTDMGTRGILDRLTQIRPKWLFMDDASLYNGKRFDHRPKMSEIAEGMSDISEFQGIISVPRWSSPLDVSFVSRAQSLSSFLSKASSRQLTFERVEFSDPFVIAYSSGTTGQPKCIVHGTGGILLSSSKEGVLHRDTGPESVVLQYTTTGWIMYLASIGTLLQGARCVLYDGSPFLPDVTTLVKLIESQKVTKLGVSPKWMQTLVAANVAPRKIAGVSSLRAVTSTGTVLPESLFHWFYDEAFEPHTQIANISGGTDLAAALGMENPLTPVYAGGCQGPGLGLSLNVFDSSVEGGPGVPGRSVHAGEPGEIVVTKSFPNMPVMFFPGDKKAVHKYWESYFGKYDNVWVQGDFVQVHQKTGQIMFLGRADGVLNPSGVRFGSAEIYNVVEKVFPKEIADSIVVGQRRPHDDDERVMLFIKMQPQVPFSDVLVRRVKNAIAEECSKRHVPRFVFETPEIPTTVNLKKVELPVKHIVSGQTVRPSGTLLNPESLEYYYRFAKDDILNSVARSKL
ncbi:MAG: hypothetical protein Q9162_004014 [Coniocarpon cinnabarinum]